MEDQKQKGDDCIGTKVQVKLDRAHLAARMRAGKDHAGPILAQQIIDDSRIFTPHDQGMLEASARPEKIGEDWAATWNTVYAPYQYYGCWPDGTHVIQNHDTGINPEASTHWAEHAADRYRKDWEIVAQREFARGSEIG